MSDQLASMIANLESNTGHDLEWWVTQALASGKERHGEIVSHLKDLGLTHGYANLVAITARERREGPASDAELVAAQYRGKESLIPIYEKLLAASTALGADVELAPKKAGVSLRRSKQFALIEPKTKTRIDLGLNLKGEPEQGRLKTAGGMCTHKVALTSVDEVDRELIGWLQDAYGRA